MLCQLVKSPTLSVNSEALTEVVKAVCRAVTYIYHHGNYEITRLAVPIFFLYLLVFYYNNKPIIDPVRGTGEAGEQTLRGRV